MPGIRSARSLRAAAAAANVCVCVCYFSCSSLHLPQLIGGERVRRGAASLLLFFSGASPARWLVMNERLPGI